MGKKLVIAGFVVCLSLALYTYFMRDARPLRENLNKGEREPRIVMEDFIVFRYEGEQVTARLAARLGHFYEPNVVELDGEIRGERLTTEGRESLGAESVTGYFNATSLSKMMGQKTELDRAELTGFVEVGVKEHLLTTDYAEYVNADQSVSSLRPVRVEGPSRVFTGDEGFTYSLISETLEMPGFIKGVVQFEE